MILLAIEKKSTKFSTNSGNTNSICKENQSQTLLLQHAAYHQIKGFFDFPCLEVDSESLILNTY